ncbi:MAG: hypothetical protein JWO83_3691 [Caulobacteraceae bacterium]|nr:hypothetical protein [Caulobacteraceae bacterium]
MSLRTCLSSAYALSALAFPMAVSAATTAADSDTHVETLIVTAQKRAENVQNVPISIEVVRGEQINDLGVRRFEDLAKYVPNLTVQPTPGANQIYIRGIGSGAQNFAFEQDVSLYIDGVYAGRNRQFMSPFFDVERVEVLRGPQGALLGKNTAAGAISIISAQPTSVAKAGVDVQTLFGRAGIDASAFVSGPLTEALSGRLAVKFIRQDGYVHNRYTGQDVPREEDNLVRGILRYQPSDSFNISAKVEYTDYTVKGTQAIAIFPGSTDFQRAQKNAQPPFGVPESDHTESWNGVVTANYRAGDFTLTSLTGYSTYNALKFTAAGSDVPELWLSRQVEKFDQTSQEVRLLSPTGRTFEFIVGGYVDESTFKTQFDTLYTIFVAGHTNQLFDQNTHTWSIFGQGVANLGDRFRVLGSLRYSSERKRATYDAITISGIPLNAPRSIAGSRGESNLDPSVTLQYRPWKHVMLYATYAQGSKAGGFVSNTGNVTPATFEFSGEHSTNYEVGLKSTLLRGAALSTSRRSIPSSRTFKSATTSRSSVWLSETPDRRRPGESKPPSP